MYIWDSLREKGPTCSAYYKKMALCLNCYNIQTVKAIHHLCMVKYIFGVLNMHHASISTFDAPRGSNSWQEYSNCSKCGLYIERSLSYWNVLCVNFYAIRYGDTVEQTALTFLHSIPANDLGKLLPSSQQSGAIFIVLPWPGFNAISHPFYALPSCTSEELDQLYM